MADDQRGVRVNAHLVIPDEELSWRFSASGGAGGQHVNTSNTRVELVFDIAMSSVLGPRQRARLLERFGESLRIVASEERSQLRNRELARTRLAQRVADALREAKPRRPTRPSASSVERRLSAKRQRSDQKRQRSRADED